MRSDGSRKSPDRAQTDESLRTERRNIDRVVAEKQTAVERDADLIVDRARQQADAVLLAARDKADDRRGRPATNVDAGSVLTEERALEDEVLRDERA